MLLQILEPSSCLLDCTTMNDNRVFHLYIDKRDIEHVPPAIEIVVIFRTSKFITLMRATRRGFSIDNASICLFINIRELDLILACSMFVSICQKVLYFSCEHNQPPHVWFYSNSSVVCTHTQRTYIRKQR